MSASSKRPFGVTILAILAGVLAVIAGIHTLQSLGILPWAIGPFSVRAFSFFNALMWGLLVWVYIWLIQMLWNMQPEAWLFLAVITVFNLILDFTLMLGSTTWSDVSTRANMGMILVSDHSWSSLFTL